MTHLEEQLIARGLPEDDVTFVVELVEETNAALARAQAAHLLRLIFLRVERDSAAGCALRRALGFSGGVSLARAAKDFCVTKQYLDSLQAALEEKLGPLSFLAAGAREASATPPPVAGPSGDPAS
jgi:hypothetical protein